VHTRRQVAAAAAAYFIITLVWTWPLAVGLARDVPADFGDPLLNAWILAWDATHLGSGWWNANIFFPHPLALAYSEHLLPQAMSILPIYALTHNPILCYNLVFLATFVLSGLGMFLFARELTGRADAAFAAGLAFAFAPYRVASLPHVQVLSSAWMPFALYGFRRYFVTGRTRPLAGGAAAWLLQNLSCGYYLLFFSPIVVLYLVWELIARRAAPRTVAAVAAASVAVGVATLPFVLQYLELRSLGFEPRTLREVERFSADVYAYATADPHVHVWGDIAQAFPRAEGSLFPGVTILVLAAIAARPPAALAPLALVLVPLLGVRMPLVKMTSVSRTLGWAALLCAIAMAGSAGQRRRVAAWFGSLRGLLTCATVLAVVLSFGPDVHSHGRQVAEWNLYAALHAHVPGFDGLRVPSRFAMIATFGLAALGAFAVRTRAVALIAGALIVIESLAVPIPINQNDTNYQQPHLAPLPDRVSLEDKRELYDFVARMPEASVIVELPLGEPAFDVRYMFASTRHWKRLVNGYSGGEPAAYGQLDQELQDALTRPDRAWQSLSATGATHAIVHEASYTDGRGSAMTAWLRSRGAREIAVFPDSPGAASPGADRVLVLK
jgi:hypothetical protein